MVRCKFQLSEIRNHSWSNVAKTFVFTAQYDQSIPEDRRFAKASPSGRLEIQVDNPTAQERFELGKFYYFDAVPIEASA